MTQLILPLIFGAPIGLSLGLVGGGGSILSVPILVYACGLAAKPAIATSLVVVGTTSAFALLAHARSGNVLWGRGALFAAFAMLGAYGGGHLAAWFSGTVLLVLFAAVMIATAVAMLRGSEEDGSLAPRSRLAAPWKIAAEAFAVGGFTGLVRLG